MTTTKTRTRKPRASQPPVAEKMLNDSPREFTDADFPVGSVSHQGDVIIVRIETLPTGSKPRANRQVAEGNTQGSRHVVSIGDVFDSNAEKVCKAIKKVCPRSEVQAKYVGPVFRTRHGESDLIHPEHGDHLYRGEMVLACVFQRNLDAEEREQRVVD